jgi:hypothetical protein
MNTTLSIITLFGCGLLAFCGVALFGFGFYGAIVGVHGGPIVVGIMVLFGASLALVGYYLGRVTFGQLKGKNVNVRK